MKKLLFCGLLLSLLDARAQINIPIHKGLRPFTNVTATPLNLAMVKRIDSMSVKLRYAAAQRANLLDARVDSPAFNAEKLAGQSFLAAARTNPVPFDVQARTLALLPAEYRAAVTKATEAELGSYQEQEAIVTAQELNEQTSVFQPLVTGGLNNVGGGAAGAFTLGLQMRLTPSKAVKKAIDPHYIYVAWSASTDKSADSGNLLKTIVFPELAKNDFIVGWHNDRVIGNRIEGFFAEARYTTYSDTVRKSLFRSTSALFGYQWAFTGSLPLLNLPAGFRFQPYACVIAIDAKYKDGLNRATDNIPMHSTLYTLGYRIQAEINGATLFFNGRHILNKPGAVTAPDLIRFVYTIGTAVSL